MKTSSVVDHGGAISPEGLASSSVLVNKTVTLKRVIKKTLNDHETTNILGRESEEQKNDAGTTTIWMASSFDHAVLHRHRSVHESR